MFSKPIRAPSVWAIVSVTSDGSRTLASPTQKTPALYEGTSVAAASTARRVLPEPPGPVRVRSRAPSLEPREHLGELTLPTDERARRVREVRVGDRLERREGAVAELVDRYGTVDVLQAVLAELGDSGAIDQLSCRLRKHHLPPVRRRPDSCGEVHVVSDVAFLGHERRPRVHADAQVDLALCECLRDPLRRG